MTAVLARLRAALARADDALLAVRDSLTAGQRWTAALLAGVALAVVLAGAPTRTIVRPGQPAAAAMPAQPAAPGAAVAAEEDGSPEVRTPAVSLPQPPVDGGDPGGGSSSGGESSPPPEDEPAPTPPPDDDGDGGEDDEAPPPCPDGIPLVVAEAGLCTQSQSAAERASRR